MNRSFFRVVILFTLNFLAVVATPLGRAGTVTWNLNPVDNNWGTADNWTPARLPTDIAAFGPSNIAGISIDVFVSINGITFNSDASSYSFTLINGSSSLGLNNGGVTNNSAVTQYFHDGGVFFYGQSSAGSNVVYTMDDSYSVDEFTGSSTAGSATFIVNPAPAGNGPNTLHFDSEASADHSSITNNGIDDGYVHATTIFEKNSTAGQSAIVLNGGTSGEFFEQTTAENSTITVNRGASLLFQEFSTAGAATLIANGGMIEFNDRSDGGTARVELLADGFLNNFSAGKESPCTIGSVEGTGTVSLGASFQIGGNDLSTTFSGVIQDAGFNGDTGGSVTKIGSGTLTLSGANTYTGGTTIEEGTLFAQSKLASATGTGPVQVNAGTLGGRGKISGAVTIGGGTGSGAFLAPGVNDTAGLTVRSSLTFNADGTYSCELNTNKAKADKITARGVTINSGALFSFLGIGTQALPQGMVFIVINNNSRQPIAGAFANLADGSIFTANGNNFQASYEGGNGNDLTLTVVE